MAHNWLNRSYSILEFLFQKQPCPRTPYWIEPTTKTKPGFKSGAYVSPMLTLIYVLWPSFKVKQNMIHCGISTGLERHISIIIVRFTFVYNMKERISTRDRISYNFMGLSLMCEALSWRLQAKKDGFNKFALHKSIVVANLD